MADAVQQPLQTWLAEYDTLLRNIASTDVVDPDTDWDKLRDVIEQKIEKNISLFLTTTQKPPTPAPHLPINTIDGGLKLPPFPPRKMIHNDVAVSYMNEQEANALKREIFVQLDQFEGNPPFTIQRLCELCVEPKKHYKSVGKYLRAVEKTILVTSTWDSFPPLTQSEIHSAGRSAITLGSTLQSAPSTPLFSPIPFLHDDARRSKSRSPPPTPFNLNSTIPLAEDNSNLPALGLVDEMDDPGPGHMSDHPTPLSSVTTMPDSAKSQPFLGSLEQRFVKSDDLMDVTPQASTESDSMEMDEDKENAKS